MSRTALFTRGLVAVGLPVQTLRQGLQLATTVLLGYGIAAALGLPERFWVVITVLIVMRAPMQVLSLMPAGTACAAPR